MRRWRRAYMALSQYVRAALRLALATHPEAERAAQARLAWCRREVPQRGIARTTWVAWHREGGLDGFDNRSARKAAKRAELPPTPSPGTLSP